MMFGGVPISVTSPPRMQPNDSGISSRPTGRLALRAVCMITGINRPNVPTLFMNDDSAAPRPEPAAMWVAVSRAAGSSTRAMRSVAPDSTSARLRISTRATVIVAGWLKPENASGAGTRPARTAASSAAKATTS